MLFISILILAAASADRCPSFLADIRAYASVDRSRRPSYLGTEEFWGVDGEFSNETIRYNTYFGPALDDRTIEDAAADRHVLDLFGSAVFSREPGRFRSLTGVRRRRGLMDRTTSPVNQLALNRDVVLGDVALPSTWRRLDRNARARGIPAYDLILARPVGPLNNETTFFLSTTVPRHRRPFFAFAHLTLNRLWRRTSENRGMILLQINRDVMRAAEFRAWITAVKRGGIDVRVQSVGGYYRDKHRVVVLTKIPGAPPRLP